MCLTKFLSLCSLEKVFKFACTVLTLFLIVQEMVNFAITKPTVTSMEEKDLESLEGSKLKINASEVLRRLVDSAPMVVMAQCQEPATGMVEWWDDAADEEEGDDAAEE